MTIPGDDMSTDEAFNPQPLIFTTVTWLSEAGWRVLVACRETTPCMAGELHGASAAIAAAQDKLEAVHQAAHKITMPPAVGCSCDKVDDCDLRRYPSHERPHRYMQGRLDPGCPEHAPADTYRSAQ